MWAMTVRKLIWVFLTLNFLLSRNHEVCDSKKSRLTDFSLQKIEFSNIKYDDEKEYYDRKDLM